MLLYNHLLCKCLIKKYLKFWIQFFLLNSVSYSVFVLEERRPLNHTVFKSNLVDLFSKFCFSVTVTWPSMLKVLLIFIFFINVLYFYQGTKLQKWSTIWFLITLQFKCQYFGSNAKITWLVGISKMVEKSVSRRGGGKNG